MPLVFIRGLGFYCLLFVRRLLSESLTRRRRCWLSQTSPTRTIRHCPHLTPHTSLLTPRTSRLTRVLISPHLLTPCLQVLLRGHDMPVQSVAVSQSGRFIATGQALSPHKGMHQVITIGCDLLQPHRCHPRAGHRVGVCQPPSSVSGKLLPKTRSIMLSSLHRS